MGTSAAAGGASYSVDRSLRFNKPDEPYLTRAVSSTGNQKVWTFSAWIKRAIIDDNAHYIYSANDGNSAYFALYFQYSELYSYFDPGNNYGSLNGRKFRDVGSWFHLVHQVDAINTTHKIWINGEELTLNSSRNPGNNNYPMNQSGITQYLGTASWWTSQATDIYLAEVHYSDGNKYVASDFAETDATTGQWVPKSPSITYGTNGFYLNFSDNSAATATTLGKDSSGNGNNFTPNNISVSSGLGNDCMKDSPTNNFATFNSTFEAASNSSYKNGNLEFSTSSTGQKLARSTFAHDSGKWYAEFRLDSYSSASGSYPYIGVSPANVADPSNDHNTWVGYIGTAVNTAGTAYKDGSTISGGFSYAAGDIIGMAMDVDNLLVYFYKNGTIQNSGTGYALTSNTEKGYQFTVSFYASSGTWAANFGGIGIGSNADENGHGNFTYAVPSGYLAECSANLSDPTILLPNEHFNTLLYTGNSTDARAITGVGFAPDLVWIKNRADTDWHNLYDTVRGAGKRIAANSTSAEYNSTDHMDSIDSDGFTLKDGDNTNQNGEGYVAWNWKAGGTASSNSDGTITSSVSANTTAGFSIVTYTGNGTADATVGHGLGVAPEAVIVKKRSGTDNWQVYWIGAGTERNGYLSLSNAFNTPAQTDIWGTNVPTSTKFYVGTDTATNASGSTYVAYVFSGVEGYSKFGEYEGNGSTDGTFVYTGFAPAFLITRKIPETNWHMLDIARDPSNPNTLGLDPNLSSAEADDSNLAIDFLSNGFKLRTSHSTSNGNGTGYIYFAFAESPFKNARAR